MRASFCCFFLALVACTAAARLAAQQNFEVPRSDGQTTPLMLYPALDAHQNCPPLAVISHGAGGSENGYSYLARFMAQLGYTTVVMGHRESGRAALVADVRQYGPRTGIQNLVASTAAEQARLLDVGAALAWADSRCHAPFRVLLGHSMGAETVTLEAGAKNMIHIATPPAAQDRFDAYVALSPQGPGIVFSPGAWSGIRKPVLMMTGTLDESLNGGPQAREEPWRNLPGGASHCQWLAVLDGATHMNFAGNGTGHEQAEPLITETIAAFLRGAQQHACALPPTASGITLQAK